MSDTGHEVRANTARHAFVNLGLSPSANMVVQVQCNHAHHVAAVYKTDAGLVYHSVLHSKAHGRRDYEDQGHHASKLGSDWFDLLDPGADPGIGDELPAGCECGPQTLSRQLLLEQVTAGRKRVTIE